MVMEMRICKIITELTVSNGFRKLHISGYLLTLIKLTVIERYESLIHIENYCFYHFIPLNRKPCR